MDTPVPLRIRPPGWYLRLVPAAAALGLAVWVGVDQVTHAYLWFAIESQDPKTRANGLDLAADRRDLRPLPAVLAAIEVEQDRSLLEKAAFTAFRMGDQRAVRVIRRRAEQGPDDWTRAKLIVYAARLSQRDVRLLDWLEEGAAGADPWRQTGSLLGLIELGRPEGGRRLVEALPGMDAARREFAVTELRRRAGVIMLQTAGISLNWNGLETAPPDDERWGRLQRFWHSQASARLLHDALDRQDRKDPSWALIGRLQHGRQRLIRMFE